MNENMQQYNLLNKSHG